MELQLIDRQSLLFRVEDREFHFVKPFYLMPKDAGEFLEPIPCKAGDERVIVNGSPLSEDFRIISKSNYLKLLAGYKAGNGGDKILS